MNSENGPSAPLRNLLFHNHLKEVVQISFEQIALAVCSGRGVIYHALVVYKSGMTIFL